MKGQLNRQRICKVTDVAQCYLFFSVAIYCIYRYIECMGGRQCVKLTGNMDPMCSRTSSMTAVLAHLQSMIDQQEKLHFCSSSLAQM